MSNTLIAKKSSVSGKVPVAGDLQVGELAVNLADGLIFTKDASNNIIMLGGGGGLPMQTGNAGKFLTTNGSTASWATIDLSAYLTTTAAAAAYQPKDADLTAIAALAGTSGILRKTAADTWSLDTTSYIAASAVGSSVQAWDADLDAIATLPGTSGFLKKSGPNTWVLDTNSYLTANQNITVSGDVTGSGNTSIALTLAASGVTAGTYTKVVVDAKGRVTSGGTLSAGDLPSHTQAWSTITNTPTTLAGYGITDALGLGGGSLTGPLSSSVFTATVSGGSGGEFRVSDRDGVTSYASWYKSGGVTRLYDAAAAGDIFQISNTAINWKGNTLVHSANVSSYALPLAGGNLSGLVTFTGPAQSIGLDMATNDVYASMRLIRNNKTGGDGLYIGHGNANTGPTRIFGSGSTTNFVYPDANGNLLRQDGATYLHSANVSSYALPIGGGTASGTINAPTFKTTGAYGSQANLGSISASWGGQAYPTLYSDDVSRWVMHINPHISYVQNGTNGYTGGMTGATVRFASNPAAASYWDVGVGTSGVGADKFSIGRAGSSFFSIDNGATAYFRSGGVYGAVTNLGWTAPIQIGETNVGANGSVFVPLISQTSLSNSGYRQHTVFGSYRGQTWGSAFIAVGGNDSYPTVAYMFDYSGNFTAPANVTAYSDERKKTNWRALPDDFIEQLANVKHGIYDRIDTANAVTQVGVSAQSLLPVMPHAVLEGEDGYLSVAYGNAALTACVQLAKRVVALEARIAAIAE